MEILILVLVALAMLAIGVPHWYRPLLWPPSALLFLWHH